MTLNADITVFQIEIKNKIITYRLLELLSVLSYSHCFAEMLFPWAEIIKKVGFRWNNQK